MKVEWFLFMTSENSAFPAEFEELVGIKNVQLVDPFSFIRKFLRQVQYMCYLLGV